MTKKLFLLLVFLLFLTGYSFAIGGYENVILYQATNVPNNQGVMIELSQQKAASASDFSSSISDVYRSSFTSNLPLFCIVDTLDSSKSGNTNNIEMTIRSPYSDGFYFVMDGNETKKVKFTLDAFIIEFYRGRLYNYSTVNNKKSFTGDITVGEDKHTSYTESVVAGYKTYTLSMPATKYTYNYPDYPRYYYICVNIPEANNLEDGEYTATMYLTCDRMGLNGTEIRVKGYVGEKPVEIQVSDFSFFINNGNDTYFANLEVQKDDLNPPSFDVANLQFYYTEPKEIDNPSAAQRQGRFKIYISPTSLYSVDGKYTFKRTGTENQADSFGNRIYYELDTTNTTGLTKLDPNNAANNTYYLLPDYSNVKTKEGTNYIFFKDPDTYQETWKLDGKHIYIKVADESKEDPNPPGGQEPKVHQTGTYYSYMYFTVETVF